MPAVVYKLFRLWATFLKSLKKGLVAFELFKRYRSCRKVHDVLWTFYSCGLIHAQIILPLA